MQSSYRESSLVWLSCGMHSHGGNCFISCPLWSVLVALDLAWLHLDDNIVSCSHPQDRYNKLRCACPACTNTVQMHDKLSSFRSEMRHDMYWMFALVHQDRGYFCAEFVYMILVLWFFSWCSLYNVLAYRVLLWCWNKDFCSRFRDGLDHWDPFVCPSILQPEAFKLTPDSISSI